MDFQALSASVSSTNSYKTRASSNGLARAHAFAYSYVFTNAGSLGGTLYIEGSNSEDGRIEQDLAGGTNTTDVAVWYPVGAINAAGSVVTSVAITDAVSAALLIKDCPFKVVRLRYVNSAGAGTLVVRVSSRRA
jgi:hypothetical protein